MAGVSCCKDCPDRAVINANGHNCHTDCEKYLQQKARWEEQKKLLREEKSRSNITQWEFDRGRGYGSKHK